MTKLYPLSLSVSNLTLAQPCEQFPPAVRASARAIPARLPRVTAAGSSCSFIARSPFMNHLSGKVKNMSKSVLLGRALAIRNLFLSSTGKLIGQVKARCISSDTCSRLSR